MILIVLSIITFIVAYINFIYIYGAKEENLKAFTIERIREMVIIIISFVILITLQGFLGLLTLLEIVDPKFHKYYGMLTLISYLLVANIYLLYRILKLGWQFEFSKNCMDTLIYIAVIYLVLDKIDIPQDAVRIVVTILSALLAPLIFLWWWYLKKREYLFEPLMTKTILLLSLIFSLFFSITVAAIETYPTFKCSFVALPLVIAVITIIVALKEAKDVLRLI